MYLSEMIDSAVAFDFNCESDELGVKYVNGWNNRRSGAPFVVKCYY
mgnify:CR=1 FL=1